MVAVGLVGLKSLLSDNFVAENAVRQLKFCFVFKKNTDSSSGVQALVLHPLGLRSSVTVPRFLVTGAL